jgi:hypothetical protein
VPGGWLRSFAETRPGATQISWLVGGGGAAVRDCGLGLGLGVCACLGLTTGFGRTAEIFSASVTNHHMVEGLFPFGFFLFHELEIQVEAYIRVSSIKLNSDLKFQMN